MKLITDNAFSKAWEVKCPTCNEENPNSILWFRKQCNDCATKDIADKKYTKEQIISAYWDAYNEGKYSTDKTAEEYHNETFKQD